jgi:cytochrome oxidase Cu insertion factor (SCO1/SenC/PrrC family)
MLPNYFREKTRMNKGTFRNLAIVSALVTLASFPSIASATATSIPRPPAAVGVPTNEQLPSSVANAQFINQLGQHVTLGSERGKTLFLVPMLTLCGDTCPFTAGNMLQMSSVLTKAKATNVLLIGIDVDPFRDNSARYKAYAKMIGVSSNNLQFWSEVGPTAKPVAPMSSTKKGSGDTNASLTAIEKFLGWTVTVQPEMKPPMKDWLTGKLLNYDISHSDGFWIVDGKQVVRFASGTAPGFKGKIAKKLAAFMMMPKNIYKVGTPDPAGWTPTQAIHAISWVTQTRY